MNVSNCHRHLRWPRFERYCRDTTNGQLRLSRNACPEKERQRGTHIRYAGTYRRLFNTWIAASHRRALLSHMASTREITSSFCRRRPTLITSTGSHTKSSPATERKRLPWSSFRRAARQSENNTRCSGDVSGASWSAVGMDSCRISEP